MKSILDGAIQAALNAGEVLMACSKEKLSIQIKDNRSPVTNADFLANAVLQENLLSFGWPILSEEAPDNATRIRSEYVWIIDPLDGTKSYIEKKDDFSVMIGLVRKGRPVLAVVYQPSIEKLYFAARGEGAFLKTKETEKRIAVSEVTDSRSARLLDSRHHATPRVEVLARILGITQIGRISSIGIKIGLIAEGQFDLFFSPVHTYGEWDLCAPHLILEEAGGRMTGIDGEELLYNKKIAQSPYGVLATNGHLHHVAICAVRRL